MLYHSHTHGEPGTMGMPCLCSRMHLCAFLPGRIVSMAGDVSTLGLHPLKWNVHGTHEQPYQTLLPKHCSTIKLESRTTQPPQIL